MTMNLEEFPVRPFGPEHLSYLIELGLVERIYTLGPLVHYPDAVNISLLEKELLQWNVIDGDKKFTQYGADLFKGLSSFKESVWGVLFLHNQQQPFTIDLDEELIGYGLNLSLMDTPKVYWSIFTTAELVITAVRAGDSISISTSSINGNRYEDMAASLMSALDPAKEWSPAKLNPITVPQHIIVAAGGVGKYSGDDRENFLADQKIKKSLVENKVSTKSADDFIKLQRADHVAITDIVHSFSSEDICAPAASISFVLNKGIVLTYPQQGIDRSINIVQEPGDIPSISRALEKLSKLPHRPRQGLHDTRM